MMSFKFAKKILSKRMIAKKMAFLAIMPFMANLSFAQLIPEETKVFDNYVKEISGANPVAAKKFLENKVFIGKIKIYSPTEASLLISKARALDELSRLLDARLRDDREYELSKDLQLRIDHNKPLSSVGIGPVPETLISWIEKYKKKYPASKVALIKRAIRNFEAVFGPDSVRGKEQWGAITIRERNALLAKKANGKLDWLRNKKNRTDAEYQNGLKNDALYKYLDANGRARFSKYMKQMSAVEEAKKSLKANQLARLRNQPIEQKMYLLGKFFDRSDISAGAIETRISALRQSRPDETISFQENQIVAELLKTAMVKEVKGTVAGDRLLRFYKINKLDVAIASCQNCHAKFEPSSNRMVFDSDLIQQYMRIKGITTEELIKGKEINNLAKYLSPMFIHEGAHQAQHAWARSRDVYKPYTQEDEIEANSWEALYTLEKLRNDKSFLSLMREMKSNSVYADKRIRLAARFKRSRDGFSDDIRRLYYYGIPSFASSRAEILKAISDELIRRKTLDFAVVEDIEKSGISAGEVMKMTSFELIGLIENIGTFALKKVQNDLLYPAAYENYYNDSAEEYSWVMGRIISAGNNTKASKVPELK